MYILPKKLNYKTSQQSCNKQVVNKTVMTLHYVLPPDIRAALS